LKNHFSGLGSEDAIEGLKSGEFEMEGCLSITFYTLLTRILIYPPRWYSRKWNNIHLYLIIIYQINYEKKERYKDNRRKDRKEV
jgi:hypothetical protein